MIDKIISETFKLYKLNLQLVIHPLKNIISFMHFLKHFVKCNYSTGINVIFSLFKFRFLIPAYKIHPDKEFW